MPNRNLLLVVSAVMSFLGVSAFAKDSDGRSVISATDQQKLTEKWGQGFTDAFVKDLAQLESDGTTAETAVKTVADEFSAQSQKDAQTITELQNQIKALKDENEKLAKLPGQGGESVVKTDGEMDKNTFKPDMSLLHNKNYYG